MTIIRELREAMLHLLFPHVCSGCGSDALNKASLLCPRCLGSLPETAFGRSIGNPIERKFWGRLELVAAMAQYYFTPGSLVQHLMHELKYKGNRDLGLQLGRLMGETLLASGRFPIEGLVPLPLHPSRERTRGYNQATILCEGIAESIRVPVLKEIIFRSEATDSQTRKGRIERWKNMEGRFVVRNRDDIAGRHLLLVDDVVTTGATLEACGAELNGAGASLSVATLCYASH